MKESGYKNYDELPLMLSVPQLAQVLGISRAGAYELAGRRDFPSINIGSRIIIPKEQLRIWIDARLAEKGAAK